jgi:hypothetical protein
MSEKQHLIAIQEYFEAIRRGECPLCKKVVKMKQVGKCVYGSCGHRLYQGKLREAADE